MMSRKSAIGSAATGSTRMISVPEDEAPSLESTTATDTATNTTVASDVDSGTSGQQGNSVISYNTTSSGPSRSSVSTGRSSMRTSTISSTSSDRIRLSHTESVRNVNVEKLTMNKLRFASLGLHGRKEETKKLRGCFDKFVNKLTDKTDEDPTCEGGEGEPAGSKNLSEILPVNINSSEVVFISGESGTGK
mmetsp:Transcript_11804/g.16943  ORF Transcript_11804/g.16943 Transcript_11804/m.16943 type:complete len:191 (-) Transcript_11804:12-584(-)